MSRYPVWVNTSRALNLREVGHNIYVGAAGAPAVPPPRAVVWGLIVDLIGGYDEQPDRYKLTHELLTTQVDDGVRLPAQLFDQVGARVAAAIAERRPVLIHCAAGLSRSASVAYAMLRVFDNISHQSARERIKALNPKDAVDYPCRATLASARDWAEAIKRTRA